MARTEQTAARTAISKWLRSGLFSEELIIVTHPNLELRRPIPLPPNLYVTDEKEDSILSKPSNIPPRMVTHFMDSEKKSDCAICLESMEREDNADLYLLPCCAHVLHKKCAAELVRDTNKFTCPLCRKDVS